MGFEGGYALAWLCYLLGVMGSLAIVWSWTRHWQLGVGRHLLRLLVAALLLTPFTADPEQSYLAPAWMISLLEGVFEGTEAMARAGVPLLFTLAGVVVLWLLLEMGWRHLRNKRQEAVPQAESEPAN